MKNELQAMNDHQTMKNEEDPIKLINNVKGVAHNFGDQRHTTGSVWCAHKQLCDCIQKMMTTLRSVITGSRIKSK